MKFEKHNRKGVTLIELIITIAILGIIIQVIYSIYFVGRKSFDVSKDIGFTQQDARLMSELINKELKFADRVFIEDPSTLTPSINEYYKLSLENSDNIDKKLIVDHSIDNTKDYIFSTKVYSIVFEPVIKKDNNNIEYSEKSIIKLTVKDKENDYQRSYTVDIKLENDSDFTFANLTDNINTIYYTKYE